MKKSDSIKALATALQAFHVKCDTIKKTAENPFFKSKYAPLPEILDAISIPLNEAGLTFAQFPDEDSLTTILMHPGSGEWMESSYNLHPVKSDPQSIGSAITYARRYALGAILALNIDEDDDGNEASTQSEHKEDLPVKPWLNENTPEFSKAKEFMANTPDKISGIKTLRQSYAISKKVEQLLIS